MKSKQQLNHPVRAGKRRAFDKNERVIERDVIINSAKIVRDRLNATPQHCPYPADTDAGKLWLEVFETGKAPKVKSEKKETGTDLATDKAND